MLRVRPHTDPGRYARGGSLRVDDYALPEPAVYWGTEARMENAAHSPARLRLADLLAALSVVADLGHGQPPDDAMRACLLATRLAHLLGRGGTECADVYYATLLRYVGCTAYAHEEAALFGGDEIEARAAAGVVDLGVPREALSFWLSGVARGRPPLQRARIIAAGLPRARHLVKEMARANCEVGAGMARRLGLGPAVQEALRQVYERWDGRGEPRGLAGEQLALPLRVAQVAAQALIFYGVGGSEAAMTAIRRRAGSALDPAIVAVFLQHGAALLAEVAAADAWAAVVDAEPEPCRTIVDAHLDDVARAFADMVDLKLPFTRGHSTGVAELAEAAARGLGLSGADVVIARRAGLLHDLGRLSVPNGIWERPGPLSETDWERVRLHPYHTERILARSVALAPLARPAGMHHERQDGSGYHRQAMGAGIPLTSRLLAAADTYQAMTQERPHRPAATPDAAGAQLRAEAARGQLDGEAVRAVLAAAGHHPARGRTSWPAGLSDREVEVLRLIARGASYKGVARHLVISPRTAAHHVQHIYDKIGVSTRAAAAMYAMEHDLLVH
jgi:putative nucleotidyltransferase with HDIG domain